MATPRTRTERLFRFALVFKGLDGAVELLGALLLLLVSGASLQRLVAAVLARDLLGPPDGALARRFADSAGAFATSSHTFAVLYLGLHGVLKLALVLALLRKWLRAYPVAVLVLGAFVVYEVIHAVHTHSVLLGVLALLDVAVIALVVREYVTLRRERAGGVIPPAR